MCSPISILVDGLVLFIFQLFQTPRSNCQYELSKDNGLVEVKHPGWSSNELNLLYCLMDDPFYLRVWRVTQFIDLICETAKKFGFIDIAKYERTHLTYVKCMDLDRVATVKDLDELGSLPFHYGLNVKYWLSRIGATSFQFNSEVNASESGKTMFRCTVVVVSVDKETRKPDENPKWWADKYRAAALARAAKPLRVSLPRTYAADDLVARSQMIVQPTDLDYYGHANNNSYTMFAMNAVIRAQTEQKLPWSIKEVENSIKRMECDFVSDCRVGDVLDMSVYRDKADSCKLYVTLCKVEEVIYVQMLQYDITTGNPSRL